MKKMLMTTDNVGGLANVLAIPVEVFNRLKDDFHGNPKKVSVSSTDDIVIMAVIDNDEFKFSETQNLGDGGDSYNVEITGFFPRIGQNVAIRRILEQGRWLVMHMDRNGDWLLSGTREVPLLFASDRSSGSGTSANGNRFKFFGVEAVPSESVDPDIITE